MGTNKARAKTVSVFCTQLFWGDWGRDGRATKHQEELNPGKDWRHLVPKSFGVRLGGGGGGGGVGKSLVDRSWRGQEDKESWGMAREDVREASPNRSSGPGVLNWLDGSTSGGGWMVLKGRVVLE